MFVYVVSCIALALVPTSSYAGLLVLRCIQAFGGASVIALGVSLALLAVFLSGTDDRRVTLIPPSGAGVIADISEPHERGMLFAYFNLGALLGPTVGPVIGGALAQGLGWRAIFWFLVIIACICLVPLIL